MKNNECFVLLLLKSQPHSERRCTSQRVSTVGKKCDLALGSGMFLLRLRLSVEVEWTGGGGRTRQGTHERIPPSSRKRRSLDV